MTFQLEAKDPGSRARTGRLETEHGVVETPSYVIVATNAAVRTLEPEDLPKTKTQIVIANTYHLWRSLGEEALNDYPGLHQVMEWPGTIMTDSGGFQVFSLGFLREAGMRRGGRRAAVAENGSQSWVRVTEAGVYFSAEGGEKYLDAETSIKIQEQLGGDIIVAFDQATSPLADYEYTRAAMKRTHNWARRSLEAKESRQALCGVVQGGGFRDLREASAKFIAGLPFDGFAIGSTYGDAYGGTKSKTRAMLQWAVPHLPESRPRHLFGVGGIEDVFIGVEEGIDTFDCVIPTREARHGGLWTQHGRLDIKRGSNRGVDEPIDLDCGCPVCAEDVISRGELYELFKSKNPQAGRLATIHNVYFFNELLAGIREAIRRGDLQGFKTRFLKNLEKSRREAGKTAVDNN